MKYQIIDKEDGEIQDSFETFEEMIQAAKKGDLEYFTEEYYYLGVVPDWEKDEDDD